MTFTPRPWQNEAGMAVVQHWMSEDWHIAYRGALVVAGTGSGKTAAAHHWLDKMALARGDRILWVAAQNELVTQPADTLRRWWPQYKPGIVQAGTHQPKAQAVYASLATLDRSPHRLDEILDDRLTIAVIDEAHESMSKSYQKLIRKLDERHIYRIGLTATPERGDGKSLASCWDMVYHYGILDAIGDEVVARPYVSDCRLPELDLDRVAVGRGDYLPDELERELMRAHVVEHTVAALARKHTGIALPFRDGQAEFDPRDGGVLVHTVTVDQAHATADALSKDGWTARVVWGEMPKGDRARILRAFRDGLIQVLCSPAALAQGTDLPIARTNVLARPTKSHRLYVQIFGRVLRPYDGKVGGLTIDLVGASKVHSLVGAPVLVDGFDCDGADDGQHRYIELADGGGSCTLCGKIIRCYRAGGSHEFKKGKCKHCDAPQCPESPDLHHHWLPWERGKRRCMHCTIEVTDKLFSMMKPRAYKEPVAWQRVGWTPDTETWAVDLGRIGTLFNVRHGELWRPLWVAKGRVHMLSPAPVTADMSRLLTDDVARQAAQINGSYGGSTGGSSAEYKKIQLQAKAKSFRVTEL